MIKVFQISRKRKTNQKNGIVTMGYPLKKKLRWHRTSHLTRKCWVHEISKHAFKSGRQLNDL